MNAKTKRLVASWVLLAVFLPVLVFASLHVHPVYADVGDSCTECVHHHCGGHLTPSGATLHACVLCQFVNLRMMFATVAAHIITYTLHQAVPPTVQHNVSVAHNAPAGLRGPPSCSL